MKITKELSDKFFSIYYPLLFYGNSYFNIYKNVNSFKDMFLLQPDKLYKIRNKIFSFRSVIDIYIKDNFQILEKNDQNILKTWKSDAKNIELFYFRHDNKSIFYDIESKKKLNIHGLLDDPDDIELLEDYPLIIKSVVLPFNDYLIWDGLFSISEISKDKNIKEIIRKII